VASTENLTGGFPFSTLTAQFVPVGGTGSATSLGASTTETSRHPARIGR
jgi:hypothetical protein